MDGGYEGPTGRPCGCAVSSTPLTSSTWPSAALRELLSVTRQPHCTQSRGNAGLGLGSTATSPGHEAATPLPRCHLVALGGGDAQDTAVKRCPRVVLIDHSDVLAEEFVSRPTSRAVRSNDAHRTLPPVYRTPLCAAFLVLAVRGWCAACAAVLCHVLFSLSVCCVWSVGGVAVYVGTKSSSDGGGQGFSYLIVRMGVKC
jgi:hypothetical protein